MNEPILLAKEYIIVIDTDTPSFDFARPLCAYSTGYEHEANKLQDMSELFYEETKLEGKNPFDGFIEDRLDDENFYSPCSVMLNKNYGCDGSGNYAILDQSNFANFNYPAPLSVGIFFANEPNSDQLSMIKTRTQKFFEKVWPEKSGSNQKVKFEGMRLIIQTKYGEEKVLD